MPVKIGLLIVLLLSVAACGPKSLPPLIEQGKVNEEQKRQQEIIITDYVDKLSRVERVAYRLLTANTQFCADDLGYMLGMTALASGDVFSHYREAAAFFLKVAGRPRVIAVVPGGPADMAGVKVGDEIQDVDGKPCADANDLARAARAGQPLRLALRRGLEPLQAVVTPARSCSYTVKFLSRQEINAMAYRDTIFIFMGMAKFAATDEDMAVVMGHELAHITMEHMKSKMTNSILMSILIDAPIIALTGVNPQIGNNIGGSLNSRGFEEEADYIGLYHAARAGFDIAGAENLWRRMAIENPEGVSHASTHPTTASRYLAIEAAREEINAKRAAGQELVPNMKQ